MKVLRNHRWFLSLLLILSMPLGALPLQAAPQLQGPRWLPFDDRSAPAEPTISLRAADSAQITLAADLPGCYAEDLAPAGQPFTRLYGEGYGHAAAIGWPDLPVLRRDVEVPFGAAVSLEIVAAPYREYTLKELGLQPIYPVQPPLPKVPGAEVRPLSVDPAFYRAASRYPDLPVRLGEAYIVRGHRLQPVEIWPVAYDPRAGTVRLYSQVAFRLALSGSDPARTAELAVRYASPAFDASLSHRVLHYNQGRPLPEAAAVGYLIIAADAYYDAIQPLATLRASRGFAVTTTRCSQIPGGCLNATAIKSYIQTAYDTWPIPPSYVLLVGDTDTIAGWASVSAGEITDLYYATMDGPDDWHPDIGRGRFPVRSAAQTTIMVNKYLAYAALTGQEAWLKTAAFPATCDQYLIAEGTHNYVIDTHTGPNGYTGTFPNNPQYGGDKLYCVTYNATDANIQDALNQGRWAVIYSGHGGWTGWEMDYGQSEVQALTNYGMFPFVASHACITGDFAQFEVFGETWVLQDNKAALAFWGSSDSSYWGQDDVLERATFDSLFTPLHAYVDITAMTYDGLAAVEAAYSGSARYYWETYNILGDPAVKLFMEPDLPTFMLSVDPSEHEICQSGAATSNVVIGSILGYSETVYLEAAGLPAGITATLEPAAAPAPYTATLTIVVGESAPAGDYTLIVTATDHLSCTQATAVLLHVRPGSPEAPALISPPDGAANQPLQPTLTWGAAPYATSHRLQLDRGPLFTAPLLDVGELGTSYAVPLLLEGGRCYWWRAQGENACGAGEWAEPFHLATVALAAAFNDDMESGPGKWSHAAAQGNDHWQISTAQSHSPTHAWFVPDDAMVTDSRLWNTAAVPVGAGSALTFWHRYQFEGTAYDGAVLEISTNGGGSWSDLGPYIAAGGYNGTISTCCSNPLGGRQGWTGDLPDWTKVEVNLNAFAGQNVQVRWRLGCDSSIADVGWYIDDVQITAPLPPSPAPGLLAIAPDEGTPLFPTPVTITGSGFIATPSVRLEETWLLSVTLVNSTTLQAVVPAGMSPGVYDLILYNGDCQEALLPDAFAVLTGCVTPTVEVMSDSPVELGRPMHLTSLVTGTGPFTYSWDLGDGVGFSSDPNPVYTYTTFGAFTVTLTVTGKCGSGEAGMPVEVLCYAPTADIASDGPVELGRPIHLTSLVTGTGPFTYSWDLGDGVGFSSDPNPVYTYTAAGNYTVTLRVAGPCGAASAEEVVLIMSPCQSPTADIASDGPVELGRPMHLTSLVTGTGPFTYSWDLGDGVGFSSDPNPVYTYTAAGNYTVTLTVQGYCGTATATLVVTVLPMAEERWQIYLPVLLKGYAGP